LITAGIDGGSRAVKVALWDAEAGRVLATGLRDQGVAHDRIARDLFDEVCRSAELDGADVGPVVATGYARKLVKLADRAVTEITCHAVGARHAVPGARTVLEIGGQDSKVIHLAADGTVREFGMNDRCAAGTGRFLEVVAVRLETPLDRLGALAATSLDRAAISSMCVVFAETEIIGLLASGVTPPDIVAGVQIAMARRVAALAGRRLTDPVVFTGGVALVPGMCGALQEALGRPVAICTEPQMTGAIGAAILAAAQ
jgi:(R)-2-hydroxyacyl-CoA dehydratese activating ATPase